MIANIFLSLAAPFAVGLMLVRLAWRPMAGMHACLLRLALASGLALGISSCTFFLWLAETFSLGPPFRFIEPALLFCAAAVCLLLRRPRQAVLASPSPYPGDKADSGPIPKSLLIGFYGVLACAMVALVLVSINKPHGGGDAYAIWNLRARFLFRGHEQWVRGFSSLIAWSHPDYPLLVPSSIARLWTYAGAETPRVPQLISGFFTLGTVVLLFSSLGVLRSFAQGFPAVLFLLGTAYFIRLGGTQYADIPLGFFVLATAVLLALNEAEEGEHRGLASLAGMAAGFAAWTKNEGMLFVLSVLVARVVVLLTKRGPSVCLKELSFFLGGLLPVLMVVFYFKLRYGPPNDLFGSHNLQPFVQRLTDLHRYVVIAKAFGYKMLSWGNGLTPIFAIYLVAGGMRFNRRYLTTVFTGFIILLLMVVGYFFVYVLTPNDLRWHLDSSLERLYLQLWPTFLFMVFLIIKPRPILSRESPRE